MKQPSMIVLTLIIGFLFCIALGFEHRARVARYAHPQYSCDGGDIFGDCW
jgi:hypothetical protein